MQPGEVVRLFKNLESLDLRLYTAGTEAVSCNALAYKARFEDLTALSRLSSLKVCWDKYWDWDRNFNLAQVLRYRCRYSARLLGQS